MSSRAYVYDNQRAPGWKTFCSIACAKKSDVKESDIVELTYKEYMWLYANEPNKCDNCGELLWEY